MTLFDRSYMTSIVTMALSCTVFDIFNFEKYCDLEIKVRGECLKTVHFILLMFETIKQCDRQTDRQDYYCSKQS